MNTRLSILQLAVSVFFLSPSGADAAQGQNPLTPQCPNFCVPDVDYFEVGTSQWAVQPFPNPIPGSGTYYCVPCTPCKGAAMCTYIGTGPWSWTYDGDVGSGTGHTQLLKRFETECDAQPLMLTLSEDGAVMVVALYCPCSI